MTAFSYLGPEGTFTEEALRTIAAASGALLRSMPTVPDVIRSVAAGDVEAGLVPIENSIEGSVNVTLDSLAFETSPVHIAAEIILPVRHALLGVPDGGAHQITDIVSHPHASAQCRDYLAASLPSVRMHAANSTAEAAREVAERADPAWAAIGAAIAAELYGLKILAADIEDRAENETRFVLVSREQVPPTGDDKTSLVCFIEADRPGSLLAILHEFSDRQINLTKLESRPTKERLGEYCFFIDMEGHASTPPLRYAIESLRTKILEVKVLGSYPRARKEADA